MQKRRKSCIWDWLNPSNTADWGLTGWGYNGNFPFMLKDRLLTDLHSREARDNNHTLKTRKVLAGYTVEEINKSISMSIIKHWKRLSREAAESRYMGVFKVQLDKAGANWSEFSADLLLAGGWTKWPHPKVPSSLNGSVKLIQQIIFQKLTFNYLQKQIPNTFNSKSLAAHVQRY